MIPYEDLVAALAAWRARQGLPSGQIAGAPAAAPAAPAPKPAAPAAAKAAPAARPAAMIVDSTYEDSVDVDEAALLDEASLESDFAMSFGAGEPAEATAIGAPPAPPPRRGGR